MRRRLGLVGALFGAGLMLAAVVPLAVGTTVINMTTADITQTYNNAVFKQGPLPSSAGTGVLDPFLRIGANMDIVQGYNTDYRPLQYQEDSPWTESLLLSTVPTISYDGGLYRVFYLDINQVNSVPDLSLDDLRLFLANSPTLTNFDPAANTFGGVPYVPIWELGDAYIHLNYALEAGSGDSDMTMLVPETLFSGATNCTYGQAGCNTWLYFYNKFGATYVNNDGFEEWATQVLPYVQLSKDATGTYDRTITWDLTKTGSPLLHSLWAGQSADTDYDIVLDKTVVDSAIQVTGTISIVVPDKLPDGDKNSPDAVVTSLTDVFTQGAVTTPGTISSSCTVPFTVKGGDTKTCTYTVLPLTAAPGTNTVTAVVEENPTAFTFSAPVTFTQNLTGYDNVDVTDTFPYPGGAPELIGDEVAADITLDNDQTFSCSSDPAMYAGDGFYSYTRTNRAQIVETGAYDEVTVTVNCYAPVVSKDADESYTRGFTWTITKSGLPLTHTLWAGQNAPTDYDIVLDKTFDDFDFAVSGKVYVQNPAGSPGVMNVDVADAIGATNAVINCGGGPGDTTLSVAVGATAYCTYTVDLGDGDKPAPGTNNATVTFMTIPFAASAGFAFGDPTSTTGYDNVDVTDTFPYPGGAPELIGDEVAADTTLDNDQTFSCSSDPAMYAGDGFYSYSTTNRAIIVETGQYDEETVTVNCYAPVVSKDADESYTRTFTWTIAKSGDPLTHYLWAGESDDTDYDIVLDKTTDDTDFLVSGKVYVQNPAGSPGVMNVDVADAIGATNAVINCGGGPGDTTLSVAVGATAYCTYSVDLGDADKPAPGTNNATVTFMTIPFAASAGFAFGDPTTVVGYENVDVTDTFPFPGGAPELIGDEVAADTTLDNDQTFTCSSDPAAYTDGHYSYARTNRAIIVETGQYDEETVTVHCYAPVVSKTATATYDRYWDWTIDKVGDQTTLELAVGQQFLVNYDVTVNATKTETGYEVHGVISVQNPSSIGPMDVTVADAIGGSPAEVNCGGGWPDPTLTVAALSTGTCDYRLDFGANKPLATTNVATVTFNAIPFTASQTFSWVLDTETDECINVTDDVYGSLGLVCADDPLPKVFHYSMFVGPFAVCGPYEFPNTATFVTNDTATTDSDGHIVLIDVPCGGCTLTPGYWKTHSEYGPAPYDDTWALLDALESTNPVTVWAPDGTKEGADELFFYPRTSATWYDVFWTAPKGNAYYQLAHHYEAAVLNVLNEASVPTEVATAIAHAEYLFETYTPANIAALKGNDPVRKDFIATAATLAKYNEGIIGPGHCDEDYFSRLTTR